jgi:hypothetical protein
MLHPVPDSTQRRRLLRVVALQRRLIRRLCALEQGAQVDLPWLEVAWRELPADWVRRFWENDKGRRANWIRTLAGASATEKARLMAICHEQLRFRLLWEQGGALTLEKVEWSKKASTVLDAANGLLKSFYAPLFYDDEGYRLRGGALAKSAFVAGIEPAARKVCPYCDNFLQTTELDHFLPKDDFPFLSCHPDNLIPSCHDSNRGGHKGTIAPLDWDAADQAADWFHPRWRSADGRVQVEIAVTTTSLLSARLIALDVADSARVARLDGMFRLSEFWSSQIEDELQLIGSQVGDALQYDGVDPDEQAVAAKLKTLAEQKRREIGRRGLAICHSALYRFAADTPSVVADILRQCRDQLGYECA